MEIQRELSDVPAGAPVGLEMLHACEARIERGFREAGEALRQINEEGSYRQGGYATFEEYCQRRWGMDRSRAYQLMSACQVIENLSTVVDVLPASEFITRPLTRLSVEQQRQVWQQVVAETEETKITAEKVRAVKERVLGQAEWTEKRREDASQLIVLLPEGLREQAESLVAAPGFAFERAMQALGRLASFGAAKQRRVLSLYHSADSREKSVAVALLLDQNPAADPRRAIYESVLSEMRYCTHLFPGDPLEERLGEHVREHEVIVSLLREAEKERFHGADQN